MFCRRDGSILVRLNGTATDTARTDLSRTQPWYLGIRLNDLWNLYEETAPKNSGLEQWLYNHGLVAPEPAASPGNLSDRKILKFFLASFQTYQSRQSRTGGRWHPMHFCILTNAPGRSSTLVQAGQRKLIKTTPHEDLGSLVEAESHQPLPLTWYICFVPYFLLHLFMYLFSVCGMPVYTWQFTWISSILPPCGFHGLNSGPQA